MHHEDHWASTETPFLCRDLSHLAFQSTAGRLEAANTDDLINFVANSRLFSTEIESILQQSLLFCPARPRTQYQKVLWRFLWSLIHSTNPLQHPSQLSIFTGNRNLGLIIKRNVTYIAASDPSPKVLSAITPAIQFSFLYQVGDCCRVLHYSPPLTPLPTPVQSVAPLQRVFRLQPPSA
ncbi:hypothetical protein BCR34DRAFT_267696 [Clohesyomyces aquaticus]|uniref:Uncharacterized protein n=1 Tax=Clohesyomyces aquaticus TaxID=1231657 RepID=A0A1Y1ZT38_9PLEO|nr:hypothetical protein BCR34DRAFT_267696 [Clohesyomyces aquaticus]